MESNSRKERKKKEKRKILDARRKETEVVRKERRELSDEN